jgi:hypothetical protein
MKFFFEVDDERCAGGPILPKYYLVVWLKELILGLYTMAIPNISIIHLIFTSIEQ